MKPPIEARINTRLFHTRWKSCKVRSASGGEYPNKWETQNLEDGVLHIFTPTQSVKDRLATAIHYRDFNSARQAAEIAKLHLIDMDDVKAWCEQEGGPKFYEIFAAYLK